MQRLPLDVQSLLLLKAKVKDEFVNSKRAPTHSVVDLKKYRKLSAVLGDILDLEKFKQVGTLLDFIYKDNQPVELWMRVLQQTKYSALKAVWPQVHLLPEFGLEKHIKLYNKELQKLMPVSEFLLMKELDLKLPKSVVPLTPLSHSAPDKVDLEEVVRQAKAFHEFLDANFSRLLDLKIQPFDVRYEPSKFGLPLSVASREYRLRTHITYFKSLLQTFRPLHKEDLDHLIAVATGQGELNPGFAKYMLRKRQNETVSPYEKKYLRQKQLIPNERNVRFLYREYVVVQFFHEKGSFHMSPMVNIYD